MIQPFKELVQAKPAGVRLERIGFVINDLPQHVRHDTHDTTNPNTRSKLLYVLVRRGFEEGVPPRRTGMRATTLALVRPGGVRENCDHQPKC